MPRPAPGWMPRGRAGTRTSTSSSPPMAVRASPRRSASPLDLWVGDGDSLGEDGIAALAATGVPIERSRPDKDETDVELAVDAAIARGAARLIIVGALGRRAGRPCARERRLLARDGPHRPAGDPARRPIADLAAPRTGPDGDAGRLTLHLATRARWSRSCRSAAMRRASPPTAWSIRSRTRRFALGPARGVSNVDRTTGAHGDAPARPPAGGRIACYALSHDDARRRRPRP